MESSSETIKVGSRKSELALIQTNSVIEALKKHYPQMNFEIVKMNTTGDKILDKPLPKIGEKSLFTKELEIALDDKSVDFVVHSLKDLPTTLPTNLAIGGICKREDPRDAVVIHSKLEATSLSTLSKSSVIGTSSLRRVAQLRQHYPHLDVQSIRGNLNTRLSKLENSVVVESNEETSNGTNPLKYSAIILAVAGIERMGWKEKISQVLEPSELMYAVGQGALAIECRSDDEKILDLLAPLHDRTTVLRVVAERCLLKKLGGGCSAPVAVNCTLNAQNDSLSLEAGVWSLDGKKSLKRTKETTIKSNEEPPKKIAKADVLFAGIKAGKLDEHELRLAQDLGIQVAEDLIKAGALEIMDEARAENETPEAKQIVEDAKKMASSGQAEVVKS
ncbi:porphobilinogen deaminase [Neocloeon triangulifer]|uniref:porphobilinogen deaminase n=1 Tax=Neocloeon triangulifer TaxID=2078957 RepID=UPI00286F79F8|nr:porphobilinogen deaminase [Neocloeon triangulifer]